MIKKFILLILSSLVIPAYAGEFENAIHSGKPVFLYIHAPWCGSCRMFSPVYHKLSSAYSGKYVFLKLDTDSSYGRSVANRYSVKYIPYVALFKPNSTTPVVVPHSCKYKYSCMDEMLTKFTRH